MLLLGLYFYNSFQGNLNNLIFIGTNAAYIEQKSNIKTQGYTTTGETVINIEVCFYFIVIKITI